MDCSSPDSYVLHCLPGFAQTHVYWVTDAIQLSHPVTSFLSCPQSFPASESFPMSRVFASCGQSIGASTLASILPVNIQDWFPLGLIALISIWCALNPRTGDLIRKPCDVRGTHTGGGQEQRSEEGSSKPRGAKHCRAASKAGKGKEGASPGALRESRVQLTPWF